jgi:hypothetical protein
MGSGIQKLAVQTDSLDTLEQYLRLALCNAIDGDGSTIAVKIVNRGNKNYGLYLPPLPQKSFPVILIQGWYQRKDGEKPHSYFNGYRPWRLFGRSEQVIAFTRMTLNSREEKWNAQFLKKCGDGYTDSFNHFDGSVSVGYELRTCSSFPEILAISLVHIYHGK